MSETEDKLARELGWKIHYKGADGYILEHPANSETITSFASDSLSGKLWRKCLELTEQRERVGTRNAREFWDKWQAEHAKEIDSQTAHKTAMQFAEAYASSRLAEVTAQLEQNRAVVELVNFCADAKHEGETHQQCALCENATLRAELERLTKIHEQVKQEITEEPTIGRTVELLFREPLEKAEAEIRELKQELARLTGERDAVLEEAAQLADETAHEYSRSSSKSGDYHYAKTVAANSVAAAIRAKKKNSIAEAALPSDTPGAKQ